MTEMKTAVMTEIGSIEFENRARPEPAAGEVLVKLEYVGVCGSDLHYYEAGRIGDFVVKPPFVLGHEAAGTVVSVGDGVRNLAVGDRVALEPGITCRACSFCKRGLYNLCPDVRFFATPPIDGVFQEYAAHPAELCFKLPENVSSMEGALIEPLAVGFHAAKIGGAAAGQTALVCGAGCIGLCCVLALKAMGAERICVTDVLESRLVIAKKIGASEVFTADSKDIPEGFDIIIETSGSEKAAAQAIQLCEKGGTIVLVGYSPSGDMTLPIGKAIDKELTFKSIFRYRHVYPEAIEAAASGRIDLKGIVTDIFEFDQIPEAMRQCAENKREIVKAVIRI